MPRVLALLCFFVSGCAGLVYEVCWIRLAGPVFGSTTLAISTVVGVFFGGIAIGSWWFGGLSQRVRRPLRVYAGLEIALALLVVASPWGFALADAAYGALYRALGDGSEIALGVARAGLVAALLLLPAALMGGTFPLFCRQFATERLVGSIGLLYGTNTLGAAAGCLLAGFVLIPTIGVQASLAAGAALSLAAGLGAWLLDHRLSAPSAGTPDDAGHAPEAWRLLGAAFFVAGFVAIGTQVLWARFLGLVVRNTVHTTSLTLGTVLLGIVAGSWLAARYGARLRRPLLWFASLQVLFGLTVQALMRLSPRTWHDLGGELWAYALLMFVPMVLSGAAFPLGIRLVARPDAADAGRAAGRMTALNTAGGIAGSFTVGFAGLPLLGLDVCLYTLTGLSVATGAAVLLLGSGGGRAPVAATAAALTAWLALPLWLDTRLPADFLSSRDRLVAYREGLTANLAATRHDGVLQLDIDRWWQGSEEQNHQSYAAHLPMLAHPAPRRVLVVGVGTGQAPGRFLLHEPERVDCVDIEPALFPFVAEHFDDAWMHDPRLRLLATDGRHYLAHTTNTYDVVSIEIGQLFRPGAAAFYSQEFYREAVERLAPGGVLAQFVPLAFLDAASLRRVLATFRQALPECALFYNTQELLLLGRRGAPLRLTPERLQVLERGPVHDDLRYAPWGGTACWLQQPHAVLATFLCGKQGLARLAPEGTPVLTDDLPVLEFAASEVTLDDAMELVTVPLLRGALDPVAAVTADAAQPTPIAARITALRDDNVQALLSRAHVRLARRALRRGDRAVAQRHAADALAAQPRDQAAWRLRGDLAEQQDALPEAEQAYREALAIDPADALSLRGLGLVLLRSDRAAEAATSLRAAQALRPRDAVTLNYLGAALARTGALREALPLIERALELRPDYPSAQTHLDRVREALGLR